MLEIGRQRSGAVVLVVVVQWLLWLQLRYVRHFRCPVDSSLHVLILKCIYTENPSKNDPEINVPTFWGPIYIPQAPNALKLPKPHTPSPKPSNHNPKSKF